MQFFQQAMRRPHATAAAGQMSGFVVFFAGTYKNVTVRYGEPAARAFLQRRIAFCKLYVCVASVIET